MNNENRVKAELTEAYIRCVRAETIARSGKFTEDDNSYDDMRNECYDLIIENNSAADLIKKIKMILIRLATIDAALTEDTDTKEWQSMLAPQSFPKIPNNQMPHSPLWDDKKFKPDKDAKPWDNKFMYGKADVSNDSDDQTQHSKFWHKAD